MSDRCKTVEIRKLDNSLRAVLVPCEAESVAVGVFVASGARHEPAKFAGISHFIEHMLFKGTPTRRPIDITRAIEGRGGNFNACTGEETTCYYAHLPSECLDEAIDILSDMYLNATIPEDEFEREKRVVLEEIKMYGDEPDSVAQEKLQRNLFADSALGAPVAGSAKTLNPLVPQDLRDYIAAHYRADNTIVVVVGSFDPEAAMRGIASRLGGRALDARRGRERLGGAPSGRPHRVVAESVVRKSDIQQAQLALGYRTFGAHDERRYAAALLDGALGRGMSSRLFQEMREKRGLSYDISSRMQHFSDEGMFMVTAGTDPAKADRALKVIEGELKRIAARRMGAAELKRTKDFLCGNFRLAHERITAKLFYYGQMMLAFGEVEPVAEQVAKVRAVTAEEVRAVAEAVFSDRNRSLSLVLPA